MVANFDNVGAKDQSKCQNGEGFFYQYNCLTKALGVCLVYGDGVCFHCLCKELVTGSCFGITDFLV